jgi:hypothetical protein
VTRTALTLTLFAGLSLWASAQGPLVADEVHLLTANRLLLDQLIDRGLGMSEVKRGDDPLARAEECRQAAAPLADALRAAAGGRDPDPERVAELSDHIADMVNGGLVPNLDEADQTIPHSSKEQRERLKELSKQAKADLTELGNAFPSGGTLGRSARVAEARQKLAGAGGRINVPQD